MAAEAEQQAQPSEAEIAQALAEQPEAIREIAQAARSLVREVLPEANETLDRGALRYGARQYGAGGWGVAYVAAQARWVNLGFMRGAELPDPESLLEGTGQQMRHVKLRSLEAIEARRPALVALVRAAAAQSG